MRFGKSGCSLVAAGQSPGVGKSAQGTALTPDGKRLLVADYNAGHWHCRSDDTNENDPAAAGR